jgi:hypothetical protein
MAEEKQVELHHPESVNKCVPESEVPYWTSRGFVVPENPKAKAKKSDKG